MAFYFSLFFFLFSSIVLSSGSCWRRVQTTAANKEPFFLPLMKISCARHMAQLAYVRPRRRFLSIQPERRKEAGSIHHVLEVLVLSWVSGWSGFCCCCCVSHMAHLLLGVFLLCCRVVSLFSTWLFWKPDLCRTHCDLRMDGRVLISDGSTTGWKSGLKTKATSALLRFRFKVHHCCYGCACRPHHSGVFLSPSCK